MLSPPSFDAEVGIYGTIVRDSRAVVGGIQCCAVDDNVTGNSMNQIPGYFEKHGHVIRVGRLISFLTSSMGYIWRKNRNGRMKD